MSIPRRRHVFRLQRTLYTVQGTATRHGVEDVAHHSNLLLVHNVVIAGLVVFKAVVSPRVAEKPTLPSFLQSSPSGPLGGLSSLELGELVEDAVCEFPFWAFVTAVVESVDLAAILLEFPLEKIVIGRLAGEAISVLSQHHRDIATCYQVAYPVHARPLQGRPALAGIRYRFQDLIAFLIGVSAQGLHLLRKGVAVSGLLISGYAGVEDSL